MPVSLSSSLYLLQQYGPVAPSTLTQPVRPGLGKYGDGLFVEEGTTNLVTEPTPKATGTAWGAATGPLTYRNDVTPGAVPGYVRNASGGTYDTISLPPATVTANPNTLSFWARTSSSNVSVQNITNNVSLTGVSYVTASGLVAAPGNLLVGDGSWRRYVVTFTPTAGTFQYGLKEISGASWAGKFIDMTGAQVEQKPYPTSYCDGSLGSGYAWTGAANASTSTRAAGQVTHPVPSTPAPLTVCAWVRVGEATGGSQIAVALATGTGNVTPLLLIYQSTVQFASNLDVYASTPYNPTAGDLLFLAGTLAADGKTYTVYLSRNGGAVTSATTAASATAYSGTTTVTPGSFGSGSQGDSVVEQVLVYNRVLTPTEVSNLAFNASESTFASDPGIVYAAACGPLRGTTNAHTLNGTGLYRAATSSPIACYVEPVPAFGPDAVAGATKKISVAAGSGIGQGQLVSLNAPTGGNVSTVLRVFSPGGDYDELYTT